MAATWAAEATPGRQQPHLAAHSQTLAMPSHAKQLLTTPSQLRLALTSAGAVLTWLRQGGAGCS